MAASAKTKVMYRPECKGWISRRRRLHLDEKQLTRKVRSLSNYWIKKLVRCHSSMMGASQWKWAPLLSKNICFHTHCGDSRSICNSIPPADVIPLKYDSIYLKISEFLGSTANIRDITIYSVRGFKMHSSAHIHPKPTISVIILLCILYPWFYVLVGITISEASDHAQLPPTYDCDFPRSSMT